MLPLALLSALGNTLKLEQGEKSMHGGGGGIISYQLLITIGQIDCH